jgi:hypothetical protein
LRKWKRFAQRSLSLWSIVHLLPVSIGELSESPRVGEKSSDSFLSTLTYDWRLYSIGGILSSSSCPTLHPFLVTWRRRRSRHVDIEFIDSPPQGGIASEWG